MAFSGESEIPTPWAVRCGGNELGAKPCNDGNLIFLTSDEYFEQLQDVDRKGWNCPRCGQGAKYDGENYKKAMGELMKALNEIEPEMEEGIM